MKKWWNKLRGWLLIVVTPSVWPPYSEYYSKEWDRECILALITDPEGCIKPRYSLDGKIYKDHIGINDWYISIDPDRIYMCSFSRYFDRPSRLTIIHLRKQYKKLRSTWPEVND